MEVPGLCGVRLRSGAEYFNGHHYKATQAEASAISLKLGMDNECIDFVAKVTDDHDYAPYIEAVKKGYLSEAEINLGAEAVVHRADEAGNV